MRSLSPAWRPRRSTTATTTGRTWGSSRSRRRPRRASGFSLAPTESITFTKDATLFGLTTHIASATGDIAGDFCDPGTDPVTADVKAPPPGAFSCSC